MAVWPERANEVARWRPLVEGDVYKAIDGTFHLVQYINTSGAYCVPLAGIAKELGGKEVTFTAGGRTISANSVVQIIHPLEMGGNSPEYARYVKMSGKLGGGMAKRSGKAETGTTFGSFEDAPLTETEVAADIIAGNDNTEEETGMAKKAAKKAVKAKANGAARAPKPPKTVRACVCGCKNETTGYFAPGHDARFHGWIKKLASGVMGPGELPAAVRNGLALKQTKTGFQATKPHYYKD